MRILAGLKRKIINYNKQHGYNTSNVLQCYALLSLQIIGFFVVTLYPIMWAMKLAFYYYDGTISNQYFVGFDNFIHFFKNDTVYWKSWLNTLKFAVLKLPLELPFALFLAVWLNEKIKGQGFFRTMFFLPNLIAVAVIGIIFTNIFEYFGIINAWIEKIFGAEHIVDWFAGTFSSMFVLAFASSWSTFGVNMLYFICALQNIPQEVYEAARVDGASKLKTFFSITLPMIAPVAQTILLLSINGTLHTSELILTLTGGAPGGNTHTVMSYLTNTYAPGFAENSTINIGYGCAVSLITSVIFCIIAVVYSKASKKLTEIY